MVTRTLLNPWRVLLAVVPFTLATAEVTRVEVSRRTDIGSSGYEKIVGTLYFAVDPAHPRNGIIADLSRAPTNAAGRVEFSSDFYVLQPKDARRGNGAALVEISNRGKRGSLQIFNRGMRGDPVKESDLGDRFLFDRGFTLVGVGWEFDVPRRPGTLGIEVPVATDRGKPIRGIVRAAFTVTTRANEFALIDLAAYPPANADGPDSRLTVRDAASMPQGVPIPRAKWRLAGNTVALGGGFDPGRTYEISYEAENPPVAGLGFAAIRDAVAWLKHAGNPVAKVRHAYTFGSSQSGRFLRDFLYQGFNTDEAGRLVFDGVMSHIAGGARLDLNRRWSTPREQAMFNCASYPFADTAQQDPVSGSSEGVLQNARASTPPKVFYTNTSVEYWGGGRVAALVHTDPAGKVDVALPENVRLYVFAGTQHGPSGFPPAAPGPGEHYGNPVDFGGSMRALLVAMHRWVTEAVPPPPSAYPTFRHGTLVPAAGVRFPALPGVPAPGKLNAGLRVRNPRWPDGAGVGAPLPLLASQVDEDGNELAGIRLPEVAVPLATCTGWTFRPPAMGGAGNLVPLRGAWIPFAATRQARTASKDPRPSIEERYGSRAAYLAQVRAAAEALVQRGYLLDTDLGWTMERAGTQWDWLAARGAG